MTLIPKTPFANQIRHIILEQSNRAHVGHIGSALSVADIIAVLYSDALHISNPTDPDRDRFILSKGHAALALYAALFVKGWISADMLDSYCTDGTLLAVHPERLLPGIDFGTGSLGMGISYATGAASLHWSVMRSAMKALSGNRPCLRRTKNFQISM